MKLKIFAVPAIIALSACAGSPKPAESATTPTPSASASPEPEKAPVTFADQVASGQKLYGEYCASCHGNSGEGNKAPRVVGLKEGALPHEPPSTSKFRKAPFKTVADVAEFVVKNMPPDKPGSLTADEYWAILAFDLKANGIDLGDKVLDPSLAATLTIPR